MDDNKNDLDEICSSLDEQINKFNIKYVGRNIIFFILIHCLIPFVLYDFVINRKYKVVFLNILVAFATGLGVTAGAHRLWSHRSYKAHWTVRVFLAFLFTLAGQNDLYEWARDHRAHHKWSETNADPHNSQRGFFFAHMGWLCCKKHPMVKIKGSKLDLSDLLQDPIVRFHKKYYKILYPLIVFLLPAYLNVILLNENWIIALLQSSTRYCFTLHITWLVNSAAHFWGYKPYNNNIEPRESPLVTYILVFGEGFHNFHHTYPFDYKASEYGWFFQLNIACLFIDLLAYLGLAYDLKTVQKEVVNKDKMKVLNKIS